MFDPLEVLETAVGKVAASESIDDIARLRRLIDRLEFEFTRQVGRVADSKEYSEAGYLTAASWLRNTCNLSAPAASSAVKLAGRLKELPLVAEAFAVGEISRPHAVVIAKAATPERLAAILDIEGALVDAARATTPVDLRRVVDVVRDAIDGDGSLRATEQHERNAFFISKTLSGRWDLSGSFDAEDGEIVANHVERMIDEMKIRHNDQTPAQRRADALVQICRGDETGTSVPDISTHVDLQMIEGRIGPELAMAIRNETAAGQGLSTETLRRLTCDCRISRVITDSPSAVLDVGRATRTPSPAIRRAVIARDRHCQAAGCDMPARFCDVHHIVHWIDGGETKLTNLIVFCRRHHRHAHESRAGPGRRRSRS